MHGHCTIRTWSSHNGHTTLWVMFSRHNFSKGLLSCLDFILFIYLLTYFCELEMSQSYLRRGTHIEEMSPQDWPISDTVGACSWFVIDVGRPRSLWLVPSLAGGCRKKADWASSGEQTSEQHLSMTSILPPGFSLEFLPWLPSTTECDLKVVSWKELFPP